MRENYTDNTVAATVDTPTDTIKVGVQYASNAPTDGIAPVFALIALSSLQQENVTVNPVTFMPNQLGLTGTTISVTMASSTANAAIYYTYTTATGETEPSTPPVPVPNTTGTFLYSGAISVTDATKFRAVAIKADMGNSPISGVYYYKQTTLVGGTSPEIGVDPGTEGPGTKPPGVVDPPVVTPPGGGVVDPPVVDPPVVTPPGGGGTPPPTVSTYYLSTYIHPAASTSSTAVPFEIKILHPVVSNPVRIYYRLYYGTDAPSGGTDLISVDYAGNPTSDGTFEYTGTPIVFDGQTAMSIVAIALAESTTASTAFPMEGISFPGTTGINLSSWLGTGAYYAYYPETGNYYYY
jgi:hypothetical protein